MKTFLRYACALGIGLVLYSGGIHWAEWQFYAVFALATGIEVAGRLEERAA